MTPQEFYSKKALIFQFCDRHSLNRQWSEYEHEIDFVIDYEMEGIDLRTLENPTCIDVDAYIIVWLPMVTDCSNEKEEYTTTRQHYYDVVDGLMNVCRPDYIMGVENGIISAVCYAVWSDQSDGYTYQDYYNEIGTFVARMGGYLRIKDQFTPLVILRGVDVSKESKIKSIVDVVESETKCNGLITETCHALRVVDFDDEMWDLDDYTDSESIRKIYYSCKASMNN